MDRLMGGTSCRVPAQSSVFRGLDATRLPVPAVAAVRVLTTNDPNPKAARHVSTICAKRIVDKWVAAAIARQEQQLLAGSRGAHDGLRRLRRLDNVIH
jgi:hypothetical protein